MYMYIATLNMAEAADTAAITRMNGCMRQHGLDRHWSEQWPHNSNNISHSAAVSTARQTS